MPTTALAPYGPLPSAPQLSWQRLGMNLFVHFGMNTFTGREWGEGEDDPKNFNPTAVDCKQWARTAREAGFQIGILTAKHHDGFCLWPTSTTDYSVKSSPWRDGQGDLVREFVDAFRAEGLKVGLYLSPWDRHEPCYGDSPRYNDLYCTQLTELLTQYGELHEVWFDGACVIGPNGQKQEYDWQRYFSIVKELQPQAVTFGDGGTDVRWVGNERGYAGETCWACVDPKRVKFPGDSGIDTGVDAAAKGEFKRLLQEGDDPAQTPDGVWRAAECDVSIRPGWFYHAAEDDQVRSVENLVELYFKSAGRNSLLLLNIPPTPTGLFHENDIAAVLGLRKELDRIFAQNVATGSTVKASAELPEYPAKNLLDGDLDTFWAAPDSAPATLEIELAQPQSITVADLREPVQHGQRIAAWRLEALNESGQWITLSTGTTIGHRRLLKFEPVTTTNIRLHLDKSYAPAALTSIGLY
ncbi:alpha-L-fucosidase [Ruficoccus sp. ZRK36]|uniref:alpha-L-fucosidase n=1 Tax=Ruficoccus sp. ZRK36 TaxID=2866311 RepID=UPI001C73317C|nr:alpha-L-fucosidase [Ruficoccus sp. ZRK36]QYY35950.1 alpha-L-fucosidase [Ruficoccus sp. ZRK36]